MRTFRSYYLSLSATRLNLYSLFQVICLCKYDGLCSLFVFSCVDERTVQRVVFSCLVLADVETDGLYM